MLSNAIATQFLYQVAGRYLDDIGDQKVLDLLKAGRGFILTEAYQGVAVEEIIYEIENIMCHVNNSLNNTYYWADCEAAIINPTSESLTLAYKEHFCAEDVFVKIVSEYRNEITIMVQVDGQDPDTFYLNKITVYGCS